MPQLSHAIRPAESSDAIEMARIYNDGIAERVATFETRTKSAAELAELIEGRVLVLVAEHDGQVIAFVKVGPYGDASHYYAGVGETTLYVDRDARRSGAGRALMEAVAGAAPSPGYHKLGGEIFPPNAPSTPPGKACGRG